MSTSANTDLGNADIVGRLVSGRRRLSRHRALVCDLVHVSRTVPLCPAERTFELPELCELRSQSHPRVSWAVLFLKSYAMLAADWPVLRQAYLKWPWPHLYQHPCSVAMLAVNRRVDDEDRLYWGRFTRPEAASLADLHHRLQRFKTQPVEQIFKKQLRLCRWPLPVRRLGWWWRLNVSGVRRAHSLGTFGLSTLAGQGALNRGHPSCLTTSLTYGPMNDAGRTTVTLLYDHRVADGAPMARALGQLQDLLRGPIARELSRIAPARAA